MSAPRVGVFGGSFDPIHAAHLRMAGAFAAECRLDALHLIPAGDPYHRAHGTVASAQQRLEMVRLAIAGRSGWQADDRELRRARPSYTVDTLQELRAELPADTALWLLIGGDSLAQLHRWQRWPQLFELANLAVALRPGFDEAALHPAVAARWQARQVTDFSNAAPCGTIRALTLPPVPLSATLLRRKLAAGEDCSGLIDDAVLQYLTHHQLYRNTAK